MGIDVYHGTGSIDWPQVRAAGHAFGIVKATEGLSFTDANLHVNLEGLAAAGMVRGVYHFYHVGLDPTHQAFHFLNAIRAARYDTATEMPVVLDIEDRAGASRVGAAHMRVEVSTWLHVVEQATGKRPIIYMDVDFAQNILGEGYGGYPLWIASYTSNPHPHIPSGWTATGWKFWQYSDSGAVAGIAGNVVDLDHYNGDEAALRAWAAGK